MKLPAGGQLNALVGDGLLVDGAGITSGRVTMSYDLYIPELLANDDSINIGANTIAQMVYFQNDSINHDSNSSASVDGSTTSAVTKYPIGEWFTVQFTFDYDTDRGQVNLITSEDTYTLMVMTSKTTYTEGITTFRLHGESKTAGTTFYVDNIKYYDDAIEPYYATEKVWYNFDFDATGSNPFNMGANSDAVFSTQSGGSSASLDYLSQISKTALKVEQKQGGQINIRTKELFNDLTVGSYVTDIGMYIPKDSLQGNDIVTVYLTYNNTYSTRFRVNFKGADNTTADDTALTSCYATPIFDEEFTLRIVNSYVPFVSSGSGVRFAEAYIVDKNGNVRYIGKGAVNGSESYLIKGLSINMGEKNSNANTMYITKIRQYDASNIPSNITFDTGEYTVGQTPAHNYTDADFCLAIAQAVGTFSIDEDPAASGRGNVLTFNTVKTASAKNGTLRIDTTNYSLNSDSDYVILTADLYIPVALTSNETLSYTPYTTSDGTYLYASMTALEALTLNGENAGIAGDYSGGYTYPIGEWFTVRAIVDISSGAVNYSIIDGEGNVTNLGSITSAQAEYIKNYGVLKQRIIYKRAVKSAAAKTISMDNLKISSLTFGDSNIELFDDGWDRYYIATVNYKARGEVSMDSKMIIAAYDSETGAYIDCIDYDNKVFAEDNHYIEGNIALDEDAGIDVKVMLWNSLSEMKPLIPIAE